MREIVTRICEKSLVDANFVVVELEERPDFSPSARFFHPPPKRKKKVSRARDCNFHKYMSFLCTRSCVPCFGDALLVVGVGLEVRSAIFVEFFAAAVADMFVVCSVFFLAVRTY